MDELAHELNELDAEPVVGEQVVGHSIVTVLLVEHGLDDRTGPIRDTALLDR